MTRREPPVLEKNQIVPLEITGVTQEGNGVGRYRGMAVFVPMTAPGDRLQARIVKVRRSHAYGIVEELAEPSPARVPADCPVFAQCGGCSLRHLAYGEELGIKDSWIRENLRRIGGIDLELEPPLPSPRVDRYRNKAQYPLGRVDGRIVAGFYARRSHRLIPAEDCLLQPPVFGEIARVVCRFLEDRGIEPYDEQARSGLVRHLYLRMGEATGEVMVCFVLTGRRLPHWEELLERLREVCEPAALVLNVNRRDTNVILGKETVVLWGNGAISDEICGVQVRLSPHSFYQVNREAAQLLYRQALSYAAPRPSDLLLDLYCGAGTIGLSMAHAVREVVGIEVVAPAVKDAQANARRNGIANARFLCADAEEGAEQLRREGLRPDIVVVDPPRKGLSPGVAACVAAMAPGKVVYISCDSATLARDAALFRELGYRCTRGRGVDLFPRTTHMEAVVLLEREQPEAPA